MAQQLTLTAYATTTTTAAQRVTITLDDGRSTVVQAAAPLVPLADGGYDLAASVERLGYRVTSGWIRRTDGAVAHLHRL